MVKINNITSNHIEYDISFDRKAAIDVFLEKEFNIIPGCCSSQKSLEYHIAYLIADKLWK